MTHRHGFVLWIEPRPARTAAGLLRGTVEHTGTSTRVDFGSARELLRFLSTVAAEEADDGDPPSGLDSPQCPRTPDRLRRQRGVR